MRPIRLVLACCRGVRRASPPAVRVGLLCALAAAGCAKLELDEDGDAGLSAFTDASRKPPPRRDAAPQEERDAAPRPDAAGAPCGNLDAAGECRGDALHWCDGGAPMSVDCARMGLRCAYNETLIRHACVPPAAADDPLPQGCELLAEGECDANGVLYVCDNERVVVHNCPAMGRTCDWDAAAGRNACVAAPPEDACGGVPREGHCVGGRAEACRAGRIVTEDCPAQGSDCEIVGGRALCVAELPPDPCEGIPEGGMCAGDTAIYCVEAERVEFDCAALGWICFSIPQVVTLCSDPNAGANPGGDPPLEGEGAACTAGGVDGVCRRISQCPGTSTPGFCPGPAEVQCCT